MFSIPDELPRKFDFLRGYGVASLVAVFVLGHMIAMKFVESTKKDMKIAQKINRIIMKSKTYCLFLL